MKLKQYFKDVGDLLKTRHLLSFVSQHRYSYFAMVMGFALVGYLYLLLFPALAIFGLQALFESAQQPFSADMLSECVLWFALMVLSVSMTHHIVSMRFSRPKGVLLKANQVPTLFVFVDRLTQSKLSGEIQHVVVTDKFELDIRKIPVSGYPVWSRNVLVIGLPLLQCMSAEHIANALQRKCLQIKLSRNVIGNWLYHLHFIWPLYATEFRARRRLGDQLIAWFFRVYADAYQRFSAHLAQQNELNLDSAALAYINDGDLFKTIQAECAAKYFFNKIYLPKIEQTIVQGAIAPTTVKPYAGLSSALSKVMTEQRLSHWLEILLKQGASSDDVAPSLSRRMENIGHHRIRPPAIMTTSAATSLFGPAYSAIVQMMDKYWAKNTTQRLSGSTDKTQPSKPLQLKAVG